MRGVSALLIALLAGTAAEAQDPVQGAQLYVGFCSGCHGPTARGDGPMAPILEVLPADLTRLAADNGGTFPLAEAAATIDGRDPILAHGGPMPLFGEFFQGDGASLKTESGQPLITSPEIADLLTFLQTIQQSPQ